MGSLLKRILCCFFLCASINASEELLIPVKEIIKRDYLEEIRNEVDEKYQKKAKKEKKKQVVDKSVFISEKDYWEFSANYWLIKNSDILKWDFQKVDYGLVSTFEKILSDVGVKNKKIKILYLNSNLITHFALPEGTSGVTFLLSKPFIEKMDLTKQEISVLLLEDYLRVREKIVEKKILAKSSGFKMPKKATGKTIRKYFYKLMTVFDDVIFNKGFSFQDQFLITKKMAIFLEGENSLKKSYISLISKINELIRGNDSFKNYTRFYPSPDMQLKWLEAEGIKKSGL